MHKFSTWSLSFRTKSTRRPFSQSWNIFTFFRVSRWTWIAISAFSLSGNISNTDQSEASIILCQPIKSEYVTWLFIHGLFVWPEIVKPLDNSLFQVSTNLPTNKNFQTLQLWMFHFQMILLFQQPPSACFLYSSLPEAHVLLDGVHLVPEVSPGGVHVGDHAADVTHDGGEDEYSEEEVDGDEEILWILFWLRSLTNSSESQGWPVEAVDILSCEGIISLKQEQEIILFCLLKSKIKTIW